MNIDKLAAGSELDALVAEKVMGWKIVGPAEVKLYPGEEFAIDVLREYTPDYQRAKVAVGRCERGYHGGKIDGHDLSCLKPIPEFSTDIAAAWEVVEKLIQCGRGRPWRRAHFALRIDGDDWVVSDHDPEGGSILGSAPTAPLAICRAALKAVGA